MAVPDIEYPLLGTQLPEGRIRTPERRLMLAVLIDAIARAKGITNTADFACTETPNDAIAWFYREHQNDWLDLYSFPSICDHLGYNVEIVREQILNTRDESLSRMHRNRTK